MSVLPDHRFLQMDFDRVMLPRPPMRSPWHCDQSQAPPAHLICYKKECLLAKNATSNTGRVCVCGWSIVYYSCQTVQGHHLHGCRVREILELNQLKSAPSQLLPGFFMIWLVAYLLPFIWTGQYPVVSFQVPANFFVIVMTTGQELGRW
jgi:hypothetical protein